MIKSLTYEEFIDMVDCVYQKKASVNCSLRQALNFMPLLNKVLMSELTQKQRECFIYSYRYNKSGKEISRILGVSPATVSVHLKRARKRLYHSLRYFAEVKNITDL